MRKKWTHPRSFWGGGGGAPGLAWFKSSDLNHDLNHDLNQAIKVTKSDFFYFLYFFYFWKFLLLFVVHNCRDEEINVTKSDFFINIFYL